MTTTATTPIHAVMPLTATLLSDPKPFLPPLLKQFVIEYEWGPCVRRHYDSGGPKYWYIDVPVPKELVGGSEGEIDAYVDRECESEFRQDAK